MQPYALLEPESGYIPACAFVPGPTCPRLVTAHWDAGRREGRLMSWAMTPGSKGWVAGQGLAGPEETLDGLTWAPVAIAARAARGEPRGLLLVLGADEVLHGAELDAWPADASAGPLGALFALATGLRSAQRARELPAWAEAAADFAQSARSTLAVTGARIAVCCGDGQLHVLSRPDADSVADAGARRVTLATKATPGSLTWLCDDLLGVASAVDGTISVYDVRRLGV